MLDQAIAKDVLDAALSTGGDFAEIFMEDRRSNNLVLQSDRLETVLSGRTHGAGIRVYVGLNAVYTYTNDTDREGLLRCAKQAASAVKAHRTGFVTSAPFTVQQFQNRHPVALTPSATDTRKKADILRAAN
ncbi:MAG: DNA gyrase modulator, partial [Clostridia bacterium]